MTYVRYTKERTALLLIDPYNDFLGGGRNRSLLQGPDARSARVERSKLRTCDPDDDRAGGCSPLEP
jgi:hypothetical protein